MTGSERGWSRTIAACFLGYVVQACVNTFAPLLFLTFQSEFSLSLGQISFLITCNFGVQLLIDLFSARWADRIGYRVSIVAAHLFAAAGLAGLGFLPDLFADHYLGLIVCVVLYAIGGGLAEVLVSPIVEACPTKRKAAAMALLHSFYCWGLVFVVLASTLFFRLFGIAHWRTLSLLWAILPVANAIFFLTVPIGSLTGDETPAMELPKLLRLRSFWILMLLMLCAGASEQAVCQWASAFAEAGLHVSKTVGDLAGPCAFAVFMGVGRLISARFSDRGIERLLYLSGAGCIASYLLISLSPWPALSLAGCALCGLSVAAMWPGVFSIAARGLRAGGTALFALLALAGDLGCGGGPTYAGLMAGAFGGRLQTGILLSLIFPVGLLLGLVLFQKDAQAISNPSLK
jgi:MFS family permease